MRRVKLPFALLTAVLGLFLLALNLYGVFIGLRGPALYDEESIYYSEETLSPQQALSALDRLDGEDPPGLITKATRIIHRSIIPVNFNDLTPEEQEPLHTQVPPWENYILYLLNRLRPHPDIFYEFADYRRAVTRGLGQCGQQSLALVDFLSRKGFETGFVALNNHVVGTVEVTPGRWVVVDPAYGITIPYSPQDLARNPELVDAAYSKVTTRDMKGVYTLRGRLEPKIAYGGARARYPKGTLVERTAYTLKWLLPFVLLLPFLRYLYRRRFSATSSRPPSADRPPDDISTPPDGAQKPDRPAYGP